MNCPKCRSGILEEAGNINLVPQLSSEIYPISLNVSNKNSPFHLSLYICSMETCNHTVIKANQEFLTMLKKEKYKHYEQERKATEKEKIFW